MKSVSLLLILFLATPAWAGTARVVNVKKAPRDHTVGRVRADVVPSSDHRLAAPRAAARSKLEALSCENDGLIAGALEIGIGDFAGNVFEAPVQTIPWQIKELTFGLFDLDATYPALLFFDIFVEDPERGGDFFVEWSLDIEISEIEDQAETFTVDVSEFEMQGDAAILTLYGDGGGAAGRV